MLHLKFKIKHKRINIFRLRLKNYEAKFNNFHTYLTLPKNSNSFIFILYFYL
jgi:hypothetical protein